MKKLFLILSIVLLGSPAWAGQVKFVSMYPAPNGIFNRLRLPPQVDLADAVCNNSGNPLVGMIYMNLAGDLKVCTSSSGVGTWNNLMNVWSKNTNSIWVKDSELVANAAWKVGIGVAVPLMKLHLAQDGGILAEGTFGSASAATVGSPGAGTRFLWYPRKAALRAGYVSGNRWDDANVGNYSISLGVDNLASGNNTTISGGGSNTVTAQYGAIGGGSNNFVETIGTAGRGTIAGGETNKVHTSYSTVGGGQNNEVGGTGWETIGGGSTNKVMPINNWAMMGGTISGGWNNKIGGGDWGYIGAGRDNTMEYANSGVISGGFSNYMFAPTAVIGGGSSNQILNNASSSTIAGGAGNIITGGANAAIGGGSGNTINVAGATIAGGATNTISGTNAFIGGGSGNTTNVEDTGPTAGGNGAAIAGGGGNRASGQSSFIGGGSGNVASGIYSFVGGGGWLNLGGLPPTFQRNTASGSYSVVTGGQGNLARDNYDTVSGGTNNTSINGGSTVAGGSNNTADLYGTISGGDSNEARSNYSSVGGGLTNKALGQYTVVDGGTNNIANSNYSTIGGGRDGVVGVDAGNGLGATIAGGRWNKALADDSAVLGGERNEARGNASFVLGGSRNVVTNTGSYSGILGGVWNTVSGSTSMAGGWLTEVTGARSFLWGHVSSGVTPVTVSANDAFVIYNQYLSASGYAKVGIGTLNPLYPLHFASGTRVEANGNVCAANIACPSDERLKKNVEPLKGALDKILQLRGVNYEWIDPAQHHNQTGPQTGFIAQEVEKVFPTWVYTGDDGLKGINYIGFNATVVEALKEVNSKVTELQEKVTGLEKENKELKERLNSVEAAK